MKRFLSFIVCIGLIFTSFMFSSPVSAYYTNMPALIVVGQPDFVSSSANQGGSAAANTISGALDTFVDGSGRLFVSDYIPNIT